MLYRIRSTWECYRLFRISNDNTTFMAFFTTKIVIHSKSFPFSVLRFVCTFVHRFLVVSMSNFLYMQNLKWISSFKLVSKLNFIVLTKIYSDPPFFNMHHTSICMLVLFQLAVWDIGGLSFAMPTIIYATWYNINLWPC